MRQEVPGVACSRIAGSSAAAGAASAVPGAGTASDGTASASRGGAGGGATGCAATAAPAGGAASAAGATPTGWGGGVRVAGRGPGPSRPGAPIGPPGSGRSNSRRGGRSSRRWARWSGRGLWRAHTMRPFRIDRDGCLTRRPQTSQRAIGPSGGCAPRRKTRASRPPGSPGRRYFTTPHIGRPTACLQPLAENAGTEGLRR